MRTRMPQMHKRKKKVRGKQGKCSRPKNGLKDRKRRLAADKTSRTEGRTKDDKSAKEQQR